MQFVFLFLVVLALSAVLAFPLAGLVMLFLGAAHSHYAGIPALGYWATFWLLLAVRWAVAGTSTTSK